MLRNLFLTFLSQPNQKPALVTHATKCLDASELKLVAGGLPRGGWMQPESVAVTQLPRGGW